MHHTKNDYAHMTEACVPSLQIIINGDFEKITFILKKKSYLNIST